MEFLHFCLRSRYMFTEMQFRTQHTQLRLLRVLSIFLSELTQADAYTFFTHQLGWVRSKTRRVCKWKNELCVVSSAATTAQSHTIVVVAFKTSISLFSNHWKKKFIPNACGNIDTEWSGRESLVKLELRVHQVQESSAKQWNWIFRTLELSLWMKLKIFFGPARERERSSPLRN